MREFLQCSRLCDFDHPDVVSKANEFRRGGEDKVQVAQGTPFRHLCCMVNIDDQWIKADATFDRSLLMSAGKGEWEAAKGWDGKTHRQLPSEVIVQDIGGPFPRVFKDGDPVPHRSEGELAILNEGVALLRS